MPPGITYCPRASIATSSGPGFVPDSASATTLPRSSHTSPANVSLAVTIVPFWMMVRPTLLLHERTVRVGAPIAIELPRAAHLLDHVEIERGHDELVLVLRGAREDLPARVHEVGVAVELADVPRRLGAD